MSKKIMSMLFTLLSARLASYGLCEFQLATLTRVYGSRFLSPTVGLIIARVSIETFTKFAQNLSDPSRNLIKPDTGLHIDFNDMLVLSSIVVWRYYNCRKDGSTSPGNFGYPLLSIFFCSYFYH
jgi:hypothetical protein